MASLVRSIVSTPELSSPSGSVSSSDGSCFFSAVSSPDHITANDIRKSLVISTPDYPASNFLTFPEKTDSDNSSVKSQAVDREPKYIKRRPSPLPLEDALSSPVSFGPRHPRKLRKSNPSIPRSDETFSVPSSPLAGFSNMAASIRRSLSIDRSRGLLRRQTTHAVPVKLKKRQRRSSLPTIPSATFFPLKRDELLSRRLVKFQSPTSPQCPRGRLQTQLSPYPTRSTRDKNTDALASLAWTGNLPSSPTVEVPSQERRFMPTMEVPLRSGWRTTWSFSDNGDHDTDFGLDSSAPLIVSSPVSSPTPSTPRRHRWTLAMVITDEDISDETLIQNLEKLRAGQEEWGWRKPPDSEDSASSSVSSSDMEEDTSPRSENEDETQDVIIGSRCTPPEQQQHAVSSSSWQMARRALLICRELVRTERRYLAGLDNLTSSETLTPPPPVMLDYIPALVQVSRELLQLMEINPSAKGVADAFLSKAGDLEKAMVSWCGVVGSFFTGPEDRTKGDHHRRVKSPGKEAESHEGNAITIKSRVGSWGKRINSIKHRSSASSDSDSTKSNSKTPARPAHKRKPSVRDLAIMPTQRIMRYTMLFKDLIAYTPSASPSQKSVENALQAALSIASKCDRAQSNVAFYL
ncbi:hypothetical protein K435DRAFT_848951 [Dendrothele bispora CBS 962.96]|uniref:DH domain-containing protein n=1 Tax=Dendrothele bispora (strain CBS 962.96) TaxID=1314807 RepID=A0A4V4HIF8_DENBC|nr:hypothetical protein K435DRAFT_848951 [Dendrothele bispora CBS 962.96]